METTASGKASKGLSSRVLLRVLHISQQGYRVLRVEFQGAPYKVWGLRSRANEFLGLGVGIQVLRPRSSS